MARSINVEQKKRGRPATGQDRNIGVRLPDALIAEVDEWASQREITRSEAVRLLVKRGLLNDLADAAEMQAKPSDRQELTVSELLTEVFRERPQYIAECDFPA